MKLKLKNLMLKYSFGLYFVSNCQVGHLKKIKKNQELTRDMYRLKS